MFVFFRARAAQRYFILLEAVDGSEVYLRARRCAAGGLGWKREKRESTVRFNAMRTQRILIQRI